MLYWCAIGESECPSPTSFYRGFRILTKRRICGQGRKQRGPSTPHVNYFLFWGTKPRPETKAHSRPPLIRRSKRPAPDLYLGHTAFELGLREEFAAERSYNRKFLRQSSPRAELFCGGTVLEQEFLRPNSPRTEFLTTGDSRLIIFEVCFRPC